MYSVEIQKFKNLENHTKIACAIHPLPLGVVSCWGIWESGNLSLVMKKRRGAFVTYLYQSLIVRRMWTL